MKKAVKVVLIGLGGIAGCLALLLGVIMGPLLLGCRGTLVSDTSGRVAAGQRFDFPNFASVGVEGMKGVTYSWKEYAGKGLIAPCAVLTLTLPGGRSLTVSDQGAGNNALEVDGKAYVLKGPSEQLAIAADGTVTVASGTPHPAIPQAAGP